MGGVVIVSGNPRPGSRTLRLLTSLAPAADAVVDVADLGPALLTPGDERTAAALHALRSAAVLVVGTPTYKGSYTGLLKVLVDQLPADALSGVRAVPVVTAGVQSQADAALADLRRLLAELGADVTGGVTATEAELADIPALTAGRQIN